MSKKLFDPSKFIEGNDGSKDMCIYVDKDDEQATPVKKTRRKKVSPEPIPEGAVIKHADPAEIDFIKTNTPYAEAYKETNAQLDDSIKQLDALNGELAGQLMVIKDSKTLRNKYGYVNDITQTMATIINAKIGAIKEKNKTINDVNNMEFKRLKELKTTEADQDDNTRVMGLYDAFVNTPIATQYNGLNPTSILGPNIIETSTVGGDYTVSQVGNSLDNPDAWVHGLSPAQARMVLDSQDRVETVVKYDAATGNRWFEVIDKQTGQPVPGVEKPSNDRVFELDLNPHNGYAKDKDLNLTYRLITINGTGDASMLEY